MNDLYPLELDKVHKLKTWPSYFEDIFTGSKTFEVRKNDRDFKQGDWLKLEEYNQLTRTYTGRQIHKQVGYILYGPAFGIEDGYCVMSLK